MIYVSRDIPVNGPDPGGVVLTRSDMWKGLVMKAENALPFVPVMSKCTVIERSPNGLTRDIEIRGEPSRERITYYPERRVVFLRLSGPADGFIVNEILDGPGGELRLRFSFALQLVDADSDSQRERDFRVVMESDYLKAVDSTLAAIRRAAAERRRG